MSRTPPLLTLPNGTSVDPLIISSITPTLGHQDETLRKFVPPTVAVMGIGFYSSWECTSDASAEGCAKRLTEAVNAARARASKATPSAAHVVRRSPRTSRRTALLAITR
jgi:hypothetical protein